MSGAALARMAGDSMSQLGEEERLARLTGEARERSWPNLRPVDAATLIVLDRSGAEPRVLMGRRNPNLKFMPNRFVFPGGRSESGDARLPVAGELPPAIAAQLLDRCVKPSPARVRRLALAAIRETFEETGLVIGARCALSGPSEGPWQGFFATGHAPDLAALAYLARAITPPRRPRRFDTRFFVVDAARIAARVEGLVGPDSELVELAWLTFAETASQPLPAITRVILADLEATLAEDALGRPRAVPFYHERNRAFRRDLIPPQE